MAEPDRKRTKSRHNNSQNKANSQLISLNNINVIGNYSQFTNIAVPRDVRNELSTYHNIRIKSDFRNVYIYIHPHYSNSSDEDACVHINYTRNMITVASILYGINHNTSTCHTIRSITYINLILAIAKQLARKQPNIDELTLVDGAKLHNGDLADVKLSHVSQFEKGRSFYEAYGFLVRFYEPYKHGQFRPVPFNSDKYIECLNVYLRDRHTILNTPLKAIEIDKLFVYESAVFIQNRPMQFNIEEFAVSVCSLLGLDIEVVVDMSCHDLYMQTPDSKKPQFSRDFDEAIYSKINDNNHLYYPIIPLDARIKILQEYTINPNIKDIYADYCSYLILDTLKTTSGNRNKARIINPNNNKYTKKTNKPNNKPTNIHINSRELARDLIAIESSQPN